MPSAEMKANAYFPCRLVECEEYFSIVCSEFHYFDDYFGDNGGGGYSVDKLARKLAKQAGIKHIKFDSEAGMFCAYSDWKTPLKDLCKELRRVTGGPAKHRSKPSAKPSISFARAEKLLLNGFVLSLDTKSQREFLENFPCPSMSKYQAAAIKSIQSGSDSEKIKALRKVNSEARTLTRQWENYLSHPDTTSMLIKQVDIDYDKDKIHTEILWALSAIGSRHLPDLRTEPYFRLALSGRTAERRKAGMSGLSNLEVLTMNDLAPLLKDKSKSVREFAVRHRSWLESDDSDLREFPSWMFETRLVRELQMKSKT